MKKKNIVQLEQERFNAYVHYIFIEYITLLEQMSCVINISVSWAYDRLIHVL